MKCCSVYNNVISRALSVGSIVLHYALRAHVKCRRF